jgi:hypothetical protein
MVNIPINTKPSTYYPDGGEDTHIKITGSEIGGTNSPKVNIPVNEPSVSKGNVEIGGRQVVSSGAESGASEIPITTHSSGSYYKGNDMIKVWKGVDSAGNDIIDLVPKPTAAEAARDIIGTAVKAAPRAVASLAIDAASDIALPLSIPLAASDEITNAGYVRGMEDNTENWLGISHRSSSQITADSARVQRKIGDPLIKAEHTAWTDIVGGVETLGKDLGNVAGVVSSSAASIETGLNTPYFNTVQSDSQAANNNNNGMLIFELGFIKVGQNLIACEEINLTVSYQVNERHVSDQVMPVDLAQTKMKLEFSIKKPKIIENDLLFYLHLNRIPVDIMLYRLVNPQDWNTQNTGTGSSPYLENPAQTQSSANEVNSLAYTGNNNDLLQNSYGSQNFADNDWVIQHYLTLNNCVGVTDSMGNFDGTKPVTEEYQGLALYWSWGSTVEAAQDRLMKSVVNDFNPGMSVDYLTNNYY